MAQFKNLSTLYRVVRADATPAQQAGGLDPIAAVSVKVEPNQILYLFGIIAESFCNVAADAVAGSFLEVIIVDNKVLAPQVNTIASISADEEHKIIYWYTQHSNPAQASLRVADFFTEPWKLTNPGTYAFAAAFSAGAAAGVVQTKLTVLGELVNKDANVSSYYDKPR